jgi:hypothetical protein
MSVEDPGRWIREEPLERTRQDGGLGVVPLVVVERRVSTE